MPNIQEIIKNSQLEYNKTDHIDQENADATSAADLA